MMSSKSRLQRETKYIDAFTTKKEKERLVEILQGIQPTLDSLINAVNVQPHRSREEESGWAPSPPTDVSAQNIIDKILNDQLYFRLARDDYPTWSWVDYSHIYDKPGAGAYYNTDLLKDSDVAGLHQRAYKGDALDPSTHKYDKITEWEKSLGEKPLALGGYDSEAPDTLFRFIYPDYHHYGDPTESIAETFLHELIHAAGPLKDSENPRSKGPIHGSYSGLSAGDSKYYDGKGGQAHYNEIEDVMVNALKNKGTWKEFLEMIPSDVGQRMYK